MSATFTLAQLRATTLLVHCLTNTVVLQATVNTLLAADVASAMIDLLEEAELFAGIAPVVLINVGSGSSGQHAAQCVVASTVHEVGTPWVLDPVVVGTLPVRIALTRELLALSPAAIRSNTSEILDLAGADARRRDMGSIDPVETTAEATRGLADRHNTVVAISGGADIVVNTSQTTRIHGGDPLMPLAIGVGCSLGALAAAAPGATQEHPCPYDVAVAAHALLTVAGIVAGRDAKGPAGFEIAWCDAPYTLLPDEVASLVTVEET